MEQPVEAEPGPPLPGIRRTRTYKLSVYSSHQSTKDLNRMCRLQTFQVFPDIPEKLSFLEVLSRNLWWCWHLDAIELFRRIDPRTWQKSGRNPIVFSNMIAQERLVELSKDDSFLAHLARVQVVFEEQTRADANKEVTAPNGTIAYFSMEFGIHESLPLSAGGLGILAGDHLKAASDRCAPPGGRGPVV